MTTAPCGCSIELCNYKRKRGDRSHRLWTAGDQAGQVPPLLKIKLCQPSSFKNAPPLLKIKTKSLPFLPMPSFKCQIWGGEVPPWLVYWKRSQLQIDLPPSRSIRQIPAPRCPPSQHTYWPEHKVHKTTCAHTQEEQVQMKDVPCREAVGSFRYLIMGIGPDILYFLREVSQYP